jgi:DNA-binding response OmpR family regulator
VNLFDTTAADYACDGLQAVLGRCAEAVEAAERFRPDVMLLDIGLPKLNGFDVCRRIRGQPWGKSIVMVALTGWGQEEDRRKSTDAGFDHHMVKPRITPR